MTARTRHAHPICASEPALNNKRAYMSALSAQQRAWAAAHRLERETALGHGAACGTCARSQPAVTAVDGREVRGDPRRSAAPIPAPFDTEAGAEDAVRHALLQEREAEAADARREEEAALRCVAAPPAVARSCGGRAHRAHVAPQRESIETWGGLME